MQKLQIAGYALFFAGLFLKLFHVHYNAIIIIAGLLILLVLNIIRVFKKGSLKEGLAGLATSLWLTTLLVAIKFYPLPGLFLTLSAIATIGLVLVAVRKRAVKTLAIPALAGIAALLFYFIPGDVKYHLFNIRWNYEIERDFISWDRYSWFLYQNGKYDEAGEASNRAVEIARQEAPAEWSEMIAEHQRLIKERGWKRYR